MQGFPGRDAGRHLARSTSVVEIFRHRPSHHRHARHPFCGRGHRAQSPHVTKGRMASLAGSAAALSVLIGEKK